MAAEMNNDLFPAGLPLREFAEFPAQGYGGTVPGVVYSGKEPPECGVPLGGIDTGCLDLEATGLLGFATIFNSLFPRRGPIAVPFLGLTTGARPQRTWLMTTVKYNSRKSMICWLPVYWGGCVMTVAISAVRLSANGGWRLYAGPGARHDFRLMLATGFLLALTQIPYGIGAYYLGPLGTSVGFAVNMVLSLMAANFVGILSGEWKGATPGIVKTLSAGLTLLLLAVVLLAAGNNS